MRRHLSAHFAAVCLLLLGGQPLRAQNWRPLGPTGGDVRSLAADANDPRNLYLGTSDGHIFASRDAGEHWQLLGRVGDRDDSVVTAILVDPRNSATLYAGTWTLGPNGGGVFQSRDGGRNWRSIGLPGQSVRALAQAARNPDILVAGTLAGVFRSKNAGRNWEQISPANHEDLRNFDSIAIEQENPEVIYAGTYHLAWKTTDGGAHWMPIHAGMIDDSDVMSISIDRTDSNRIYASACSGIYRSENGGALWTKFRGIPPTARRTHWIQQDPQRPQALYSVTTEGLWKTLDAGVTWNRTTPANWSVSALVIHPKNADRLILGVEGRGIYVSDDGGRNFRSANSGFQHRQLVDLAIDRERPGRMLVVLTNSAEPILSTQDGGNTWVPLGPGLKTHLLRHVYAAPDTWWAALEGGGLLRYEPSGNTWVKAGQVSAPAPIKATPASKRGTPRNAARTAQALQQVVNDMAFARGVWLAATEGGLLASRDRGATWSPFPPGAAAKQPVHSVRVSDDGSQIWALSPRSLLTSTDGGKAWTSQELSFETRGRLRLYQLDDHTLLVSSRNALYVSGDAGKTWQPSNLPEPWIQDLAVSGNVLLICTKKGLHASFDHGRSWERLDGLLGEASFPVLGTGSAASVALAGSSTEGLYALEFPAAAVASAKAQATNRPAAQSPQK
jgi:photosystem II stability/assembly factor-like uncharacterized protein